LYSFEQLQELASQQLPSGFPAASQRLPSSFPAASQRLLSDFPAASKNLKKYSKKKYF
jgi:hypothetical protein